MLMLKITEVIKNNNAKTSLAISTIINAWEKKTVK
jgi:hypothetical protein